MTLYADVADPKGVNVDERSLFQRGLEILRSGTNDAQAEFHDGQWEAVEHAVERGGALLLVRKTGWGKSAVYFVATKILRERGHGATVVVSPLLALMDNQIEAASRFGLRAHTLNSSNHEGWDQVFDAIDRDETDILFVSPERLQNREFLDRVVPALLERIGLLVVDEAHCISDWGHDFRPDYRRIVSFVRNLPPHLPVIATTATADESAVIDIRSQLGGDVTVVRGELSRESLRLIAAPHMSYAERLGWLAVTIPLLRGSGIVYALTPYHADIVAAWLREQGIDAQSYHGRVDHAERKVRGRTLLSNELKVLVATSALGMGYDKPDIGFVVHFQTPPSIAAYYQQVGRAGRSGILADAVLLGGAGDEEIIEYFRRSALPDEERIEEILRVLNTYESGATVKQLEKHINASPKQIQKALDFLAMADRPAVRKNGSTFEPLPIEYVYDRERAAALSARRRSEFERVAAYRASQTCRMVFLAHELGDLSTMPCGQCSVCEPVPWALSVETDVVAKAEAFLKHREILLEPRVVWPGAPLPELGLETGRHIPKGIRPEIGRSAAYWRIGALGRAVRREKYELDRFSEATVEALVELVNRWVLPSPLAWVIPVPSKNRPELVPDLARRLAGRLGLSFVEAVAKNRETEEQKAMANSAFRVNNLHDAFTVSSFDGIAGAGLLVDDIYDSGFTMTMVAALLRSAGSGAVFPLTIVKVSDSE